MKTKIIMVLTLVFGMLFSLTSLFMKDASASENVDFEKFEFNEYDEEDYPYDYKFSTTEILYFGGFENTLNLQNLLKFNYENMDYIGETDFYGDCYTLELGSFSKAFNYEKMYLVYNPTNSFIGISIGDLNSSNHTYIYDFTKEYIKIPIIYTGMTVNVLIPTLYEDIKQDIADSFWDCVFLSDNYSNGELLENSLEENVYDYSDGEILYFGGFEGLTKLHDYYMTSKSSDFYSDSDGLYYYKVAEYIGSCYIAIGFKDTHPSFNDIIADGSYMVVKCFGAELFKPVEFYFNTFHSYPILEEFETLTINDSHATDEGYDLKFLDTEISQLFLDCLYTEVTDLSYSFEIEGLNNVYISNVSNPATLSEILSTVRCYDEDGTDLTDRISYETTYPSGNNFDNLTIGDYPVNLSCTDDYGNVTTLDFVIRVVDIDAPVLIPASNPYLCYSNNKISLEQFKGTIDVYDNYDTSLTDDAVLEVVENTYSGAGNLLNWQTPGDYKIIFKVVDNSGNEGYCTLNIKVVDAEPPVVKDAEGNVITTTNITKEKGVYLTVSDILANLNVYDNIDGKMDVSNLIPIFDSYSGNAKKVGEYELVFDISDSTGNICKHTVIVKVVDNIAPVFIVNNHILMVKNDVVLTRDDIISILKSLGYIDTFNGNYKVDVNMTSYEQNSSIPGVYTIKARLISDDGSEQQVNLSVNVTAVEEDLVNVEGATFFEKVVRFFTVDVPNFFTITLPGVWNKFLDFFRVSIPNTFRKVADVIKFWD